MKNNGETEVQVKENNDNVLGTLYCKYAFQNTNVSPFLIANNIRYAIYQHL